jgi:hypothetical protein
VLLYLFALLWLKKYFPHWSRCIVRKLTGLTRPEETPENCDEKKLKSKSGCGTAKTRPI